MKIRSIQYFIAFALTGGSTFAQSASGPSFGASRIQDGFIQLHLNATSGRGYVIEGSLDLKNWSQLLSTNASSAMLVFPASQLSGSKQMFYRAIEYLEPVDGTGNGRPLNDNFSGRTSVIGEKLTLAGSNTNAGREPGEPEHSYFDSGGKSVWWSWTAPANGNVIVSTIGTYFDTLIGVYTGSSVGNLTTIAKNRYLSKLITFPAIQGTTYHVAVDGYFDMHGPIQLQITLEKPGTNLVVPDSIANTHIALNETSDPNVPLRIIRIAGDGTTWTEVDNGETNIVDRGNVSGYLNLAGTAALQLESHEPNETNQLDYAFEFITPESGTYSYTLNGELRGKGNFVNFRSVSGGLAPTSIALQSIHLTRSSGQTHYFTFGPDGRFHDSDGQEHGSGTYTFTKNGSEATLVLKYTGPELFAGDEQNIRLNFGSVSTGTFQTQYTRNDGTVLPIEGTFLTEYKF